jgi:hypothetical protein
MDPSKRFVLKKFKNPAQRGRCIRPQLVRFSFGQQEMKIPRAHLRYTPAHHGALKFQQIEIIFTVEQINPGRI